MLVSIPTHFTAALTIGLDNVDKPKPTTSKAINIREKMGAYLHHMNIYILFFQVRSGQVYSKSSSFVDKRDFNKYKDTLMYMIKSHTKLNNLIR